MTEHPDLRAEYDRNSALVQKGLLFYVPDLERAAIAVGVPQPEVMRQIRIGEARQLQILIKLAEQGYLYSGIKARQFASEHGLPVSGLERALRRRSREVPSDSINYEQNIERALDDFYKIWQQARITEINTW